MKTFKRNNENKELDFIRWDFRWFGFGIFLKRGNYVKGKGIEIFTNQYRNCPRILSPLLDWHIGWTKPIHRKVKILRWDWSGSFNEPWSSWTLRIWRFGIGTDTWKFIQRWMRIKSNKRWDKEMKCIEEMDSSISDESNENLGLKG